MANQLRIGHLNDAVRELDSLSLGDDAARKVDRSLRPAAIRAMLT
jgi:hypothetical protein